jgi:Fe-S cluster assembly scaffold protein SufB
MLSRAIEEEYRGMVEAYGKAGGNKDSLTDAKTGKLVIHENKVLNTGEVDGITIDTTQTETGVRIVLTVAEGKKIEKPVHLCFGMLPKDGLQEIDFHVDARKDSEVKVLAHCIFPNAVKIIHKMDADIVIGENASFDYRETHYHGEEGGVELLPKGKVTINKGGSFYSTFAISDGRVGRMDYDFDIYCLEDSVAELVVKAYGRGDDDIKIAERIYLNGKGARGMAKSRIVLSDKAKAVVRGETYGNAADSRGHIDCMELVNGNEAVATAIPIVSVTNDKAKVTHEAAIGSVDRKQVETLMARGLDEDRAVDVIVKGILK